MKAGSWAEDGKPRGAHAPESSSHLLTYALPQDRLVPFMGRRISSVKNAREGSFHRPYEFVPGTSLKEETVRVWQVVTGEL